MTNLWFSFFAEKIKDLFPRDSVDGSTVLVLVNAVYFKGKWHKEFEKEKTGEEKFWLSKVLSINYVYHITCYTFSVKCKYLVINIELLWVEDRICQGLFSCLFFFNFI